MDLEVLNLTADASSVDKATASVEDLEKKLSRTERAVAKAEEALKILRGELVQVGNRAISLGDGFTKSQANMLAMLKQAGATTAELKAMAKTMEQLNKITGSNPFDKSVQALEYVKKQREELTKNIKYAERYNDLTKEQISLMTRGIESVRQRAASEQKNFGEREASVKRFINEFVKEAQSYNQVTASIEEKNRVAKEELRIQQEIARATQTSAKQRADAEMYVQDQLERTLFINKQLEAGFGQGTANALYGYKKQLDSLGLSADQTAAKMQEFQTALMQNQTLRADRSPFKKMSEDISGARQEVNQLARAVSVQMGDVFVSLASGMNPLIIAMQQGDQIRFALEQAAAAGQSLDNVMKGAFASMANSFVMVGKIVKDFIVDGIGAAGNAVLNIANGIPFLGKRLVQLESELKKGAAAGYEFEKSLLKVGALIRMGVGLSTLGLVSAIGVFAVASVKLSNDLDKLSITLNTLGASLGITVLQAQKAAEAVGEKYGTNVYKALDAVTLFAAKNIKFTDEMIASAVELSRVTGKSLSDIIDSYSSLKGKPVEGLLDVAIATGQVNIETIKAIDKLVEQGDVAKATKDAMQEKARAEVEAAQNTIKEMTPLGQLWLQMKQDVSALSDAVYELVTRSELVDVFRTAWETVAVLTSEVWFVIKSIGTEIGGIFAQISSVISTRGLAGAAAIREAMISDAESARKAQDALVERILKRGSVEAETAKKEAEAAAKRREESSNAATAYKKEYEARKKGANEARKEAEKTQKYFQKLMEGASDLSLNAQQELSRLASGYDQMTDSQKKLFDAQNDPRWNSLTAKQKEQYEAALKISDVYEKQIKQKKAELELQKQVVDFNESLRGMDEDIASQNAELKLRNDLLFASEDQAKEIQRQYEKNAEIVEIENKYLGIRTKLVNDYLKMIQSGLPQDKALEEFNRQMAEVASRQEKELSLVHERVAISASEDYAAKFKEIQSTISEALATALFEGGKKGGDAIKNYLKAEFRKMVLKVFIEPVVGNIMGQVAGAVGGQKSGLSSGAGSLTNSASSVYGMASGNTVAGISGAIQGVGSFVGSGALASFGAGMSMTTTQVAALSEAGLIASKGAAGLGSVVGAALPWVAGGLLVADLLGVFDKKPSDKSSWATVNPTTGSISNVGSMTGKKDPGQEQRDATAQLAQALGSFSSMAGITKELTATIGQRDGIRVTLAGEAQRNYGNGDLESIVARMMDDLVDEGTLDQSLINNWRDMKQEVNGTARAGGELISVLNLLTASYDKMGIERANLLQAEGEALEQAYARMLNFEKALSGTTLPGDALAESMKNLVRSFESLKVGVPTTKEGLNDLIKGLDLTTESGRNTYVSMMNLVPAFLELKAAQEDLYNQLLTDAQIAQKASSDLSKAFAQLGVSIPSSKEEFRKLIDALDATTQSGAALKGQLLGLVPAFIETTQGLEDAQKKATDDAMSAVNAAYDALQKVVDAEKKIIDERIRTLSDNLTRLKSIFDFLKNAIDSLLRSVPSTNTMQMAQANALIKSVLVSGVIPDDKSLEDAVSLAVQGVESGIYASRTDQERATILLANDLSKINDEVSEQVSETEKLIRIQEKEIKRLEDILANGQKQINALNGINTSVLSVKQAVDALAEALMGVKTATAKAQASPYVAAQVAIGSSYAASGGLVDSSQASPTNSAQQAIASVYQSVLGRAPDVGGLNYWSSTGMSISQIEQSIKASAEAAARSVSVDVQNAFIGGVNAALGQSSPIKAYADGGMYRGGLALVGEEGPELINFNRPGMVYTSSQTSSILGGDLSGAFEDLRQEFAMLRAETRAVVSNTSKMARILDDSTQGGDALRTVAV